MLRQIFWRPDVVLVVAPAFVCAPTALLTARLCGAEAWLHLQDFEVDVAFRLGLLRGKLMQRLILRMERWVLRRFDVVSSISSRMVERLLTKGVQQERTRYFPNWVDMSHVRPSQASGSYRAQLGIAADAVVVLFSGSLGAKQGLMMIPEAARILAERREIQFVICGDGVMRSNEIVPPNTPLASNVSCELIMSVTFDSRKLVMSTFRGVLICGVALFAFIYWPPLLMEKFCM